MHCNSVNDSVRAAAYRKKRDNIMTNKNTMETVNVNGCRMIVTDHLHTCGNRVVIPFPKSAEFISGTYTVFIKCFCPTCQQDALLHLAAYYDAYQGAKQKILPRKVAGAV